MNILQTFVDSDTSKFLVGSFTTITFNQDAEFDNFNDAKQFVKDYYSDCNVRALKKWEKNVADLVHCRKTLSIQHQWKFRRNRFYSMRIDGTWMESHSKKLKHDRCELDMWIRAIGGK